MQLITSLSKYFIFMLILLSCSLLLDWNGSSTPLSIPITLSSNIDVEENVSAKPAASIWSEMSGQFKLDHQVQNSQVQAEIRKLVADQHRLYQILTAAGPYIYFIHQQILARGLPAELGLIPFIESEYNPNDRSNKGATGLWQLMSGTAHELGVKVKSGYDGRKNVIASTKAALAYFKDLGNDFNSNWYLAIAAYNCGQGKVKSAQRHAAGSTNFWNLHLPRETQIYVPRLLAIAEIIKNPERYAVQLPPIVNQPYFAELKVKGEAISLSKVAKSSDTDIKTLHKLNPDYDKQGNISKILTKDGASLLVPINKAPEVKAQFNT